MEVTKAPQPANVLEPIQVTFTVEEQDLIIKTWSPSCMSGGNNDYSLLMIDLHHKLKALRGGSMKVKREELIPIPPPCSFVITISSEEASLIRVNWIGQCKSPEETGKYWNLMTAIAKELETLKEKK